MNTEQTAVRLAIRADEFAPGISREELIRLLAHEAAEQFFPGKGAELAGAALAREAEEPTYLGRGLAVPHARLAGLSVAAVYVAHGSGVCWPDEAVDCVVLLCVPEEQPELHLQLLGRIVRWRMKGGELTLSC